MHLEVGEVDLTSHIHVPAVEWGGWRQTDTCQWTFYAKK